MTRIGRVFNELDLQMRTVFSMLDLQMRTVFSMSERPGQRRKEARNKIEHRLLTNDEVNAAIRKAEALEWGWEFKAPIICRAQYRKTDTISRRKERQCIGNMMAESQRYLDNCNDVKELQEWISKLSKVLIQGGMPEV